MSSLVKCTACGSSIASSAPKCPRCGKPRTTGAGIILAIVIGVAIGIFVLVRLRG